MSDYQISKGYFGLLKDPLPRGTVEDLMCANVLPEGWLFSHDGTMIVSNDQKEAYDVELIFVSPEADVFRQECADLGYEVDQVKFYACHWYNGSDSPMSTATKEGVFL